MASLNALRNNGCGLNGSPEAPGSVEVPWHRLSTCNMLFARGAVRLGSLELELWQRRGEMGLVRHWSPKLRDVLSACCSYEGPGARGVRLGLYGDHHGFGLWEAAVSLAFHEGDDQAKFSGENLDGKVGLTI
eukprot:s1569_g14.t1